VTAYDPRHYRIAARLHRDNPGWLIPYGPWSRHYWAFPSFSAPAGTIITATDPAELATLMRQAELAATRPGPPPPTA